MNIIIYLRGLIVSLLSALGLPYTLTLGLADVSLVAIALGLIIAVPELAPIVVIVGLLVTYVAGK